MVQLLGKYQFLRQVVVALLSLCLAVPMPLFCRCDCVFGQSSCCSVRLVPTDCDQTESDQPVQFVPKSCCEHCQPKPVSTHTSKKGCCSEQPEDALANGSDSAPWFPCHCVLQRAPDLSRIDSTDYTAVTLKSLAHAYSIPDYDLSLLIASTSPLELAPTRYPPSHQQRLALLGTWLN
jgi:hypothetical protein